MFDNFQSEGIFPVLIDRLNNEATESATSSANVSKVETEFH